MSAYYVCDKCADLTAREQPIPEGAEWTCILCGSHAAWEFPRHREALEQSRSIQAVVDSRLFRTARRRGLLRARLRGEL